MCDAIIDHAPAHVLDGRIGLEVSVSGASLQLCLGPLAPSSAETILADCTIPGIGNVLTRVTDRVSVEPVTGGEQLVLGLDFDGAQRPSGPVGLPG